MEEKNAAPAKLSLNSISSLFSETWRTYQERFAALIEILLLPTLVTVLGYILLTLGFPFTILGGVVIFLGWILFVFSTLPIIFSIHNKAGVDASYKATIGLFLPLIWLIILEVLAVMGGFIMLIVPGIWLSISFSLTSYVFVIEHRRGMDALRQSKEYIKGYWWAFLGRVLLLGIIYCVLALVIQLPVGILLGKFAGSIVSMLLALFIAPFFAIYNYTIYKNLRELKPELADGHTKKGTGFIKASAIVGIVVPILLFLTFIFVAGFGIFQTLRYAHRDMHYSVGANP
jgi:hypothetical protein